MCNAFEYEMECIVEFPRGCSIEKEIVINATEEWYGHSFGSKIGRMYEDGRIESLFSDDKHNNTTRRFINVVNTGKVVKKAVNIYNKATGECTKATDYFILYRPKEHSAYVNTADQECLDYCSNADFEYTYEILFVLDTDWRRYITGSIKTSGRGPVSLVDIMQDLDMKFEDWAYNNDLHFSINDDNDIVVRFYNEIGEWEDVAFASTRELILKINSIRIIDIKCILVE